MIVQEDCRQRRGIEFVLHLGGYLGGKLWVQGVYAFHHEHVARVQTQPLATHHRPSCREVIAWHLHLLTPEEFL